MQKISVAIIRQGLSAVYDRIVSLRGVGTASCSNGSVEFRLVTASGTCHKACGRNCMRFLKASGKVKRFGTKQQRHQVSLLYTKACTLVSLPLYTSLTMIRVTGEGTIRSQ